uniref:ATP synthase complex subunit 8 n=1 Tax=Calameuta filiformis TaxID=222804 RepID=A0A0S1S683_9HYME|nr:ATP synthase F0 subunit 8 [Calameuta filiformis]ALM04131.1 ATP synthase F0 subunit 8 [Calameuta filiformis]
MPQMSPMNWLILMFFFTMILFMCMCMIYYIYLPQNSNKSIPLNNLKFKKNHLNWKW